jgi:predicted transcriptional regulator
LPESLEDKILSTLQSSEDLTMTQSGLAKVLDMTSRDISRIVVKLERRGVVKRVQVKEGGRNSYKVKLLKKTPRIDLSDVVWCACFTCADLEKCGKGQPVSPEICNKLTTSLRAEHSKLEVLGGKKPAE